MARTGMKLYVLVGNSTDHAKNALIYQGLKDLGLRSPCDWQSLHETPSMLKVEKLYKRNRCAYFIVPPCELTAAVESWASVGTRSLNVIYLPTYPENAAAMRGVVRTLTGLNL